MSITSLWLQVLRIGVISQIVAITATETSVAIDVMCVCVNAFRLLTDYLNVRCMGSTYQWTFIKINFQPFKNILKIFYRARSNP